MPDLNVREMNETCILSITNLGLLEAYQLEDPDVLGSII
jgi:hypothetical protein